MNNKLTIVLFVYTIVNSTARIFNNNNNIFCNTNNGFYYCIYSKSCIPITDDCINLIMSNNYFSTLFS